MPVTVEQDPVSVDVLREVGKSGGLTCSPATWRLGRSRGFAVRIAGFYKPFRASVSLSVNRDDVSSCFTRVVLTVNEFLLVKCSRRTRQCGEVDGSQYLRTRIPTGP